MFLDSDDWVDINTIDDAINGVKKNKTDVVLWNYVKEYSNLSKPVDVFQDELFFDMIRSAALSYSCF